MNATDLLRPSLLAHPDAAEFAEALAAKLGRETMRSIDGAGWYAWDAPIPARSQWEAEAAELAAHIHANLS